LVLGGVGSFAAEFLARAGVGNLTIVDGDTVDITNVNRQLPALHSTVGKNKVEVVAERILDINPEVQLVPINEFYRQKEWTRCWKTINSIMF
jgi:tRNA A37 threonylcarbamoyladenosine dehydratase